jgi:hypothetical protein
MDAQLVMGVLNETLGKCPHPEIFNTDQGSQYTSEVYTQRLKKTGYYYIYAPQGHFLANAQGRLQRQSGR